MSRQARKEFEQLYRSWPDRRLIDAATTSRADYTAEAVDVMDRELERRGIRVAELDPAAGMSELELAEADLQRERARELNEAPIWERSLPADRPKNQTLYTYSSAEGLASVLRVLLVLGFMANLAAAISGYFEFAMLGQLRVGVRFADSELDVYDDRKQLIAALQVIAFVITGLVFLSWSRLSCKNAHALSERPLRYTPGWSVGWYFVPIFNLWKPYGAMVEIWHGSQTEGQERIGHGLLAVWWFLWLFSNFMAQGASALSEKVADIDSAITSTVAWTASDAVDMLLYAAVLALVIRVRRFQVQTSRHQDDVPGLLGSDRRLELVAGDAVRDLCR